jgi:hypothetical protein
MYYYYYYYYLFYLLFYFNQSIKKKYYDDILFSCFFPLYFNDDSLFLIKTFWLFIILNLFILKFKLKDVFEVKTIKKL